MAFFDMSPSAMAEVDKTIAFVGAAGEMLVLLFLMRSKTYRTLPFFSIYIAWTILSDLFYVYLQSSLGHKAYLHFYLGQVIVDSLLQFAFLVELAWSVLRPIQKSLPKFTLYILIGLLAGVGLIIWPFAGMGAPSGNSSQDVIIQHFLQTFAILRVICFLLLAGFSQLLSIGWRDRELQVATGLGFFSIISLIISVLHTHPSSEDTYHRLDWVTSCSYLGSLFFWVYCFSTSEQKRREFTPQMQHFLLQMGGGARTGRIALTNLSQDRSQKKD